MGYIYREVIEKILMRNKIMAGNGPNYHDNFSGYYEEIYLPQGGQFNKAYGAEDLDFKLASDKRFTPEPDTKHPMKSIREGSESGNYHRIFYNKDKKKFLQLYRFMDKCLVLCCNSKCLEETGLNCNFTDNFKNTKE